MMKSLELVTRLRRSHQRDCSKYLPFPASSKADLTHYADSLYHRLIRGIHPLVLSIRTSKQTGVWGGIQAV